MSDQVQTTDQADQTAAVTLTDAAPAAKTDELETLRAQLAESNAKVAEETGRREAAEARAAATTTEHRSQLAEQVTARFTAEEQAVEASLLAASGALKTTKDSYTKALEEGRFADATDLAEQIADAKLSLNGANWRKNQLSEVKKRAETEASRHTETRADPIEAMIATVSPASQQWLRSHRDIASKMASDPRYMARVTAASNHAYAEGHDYDTPSYFSFVERELNPQAGTEDDDQPAPAQPAARKRPGQTAAAAPASRRPVGAVQTGRTVHIDDIVRKMTTEMRMAAKTAQPNLDEDEALKLYARGIVASKERDPSFLPEFRI